MRSVLRSDKRLLMRGVGPQPCLLLIQKGQRPRYVGAAFTVRSEAELVRLEPEANARRLSQRVILGGGSGVRADGPRRRSVMAGCIIARCRFPWILARDPAVPRSHRQCVDLAERNWAKLIGTNSLPSGFAFRRLF